MLRFVTRATGATGAYTVANVAGSGATVSGLTALTSYDWSVREICAAGDTTVWSSDVTTMTAACGLTSQCQYTVYMEDSWGDGWNGNVIDFIQGGTSAGTVTLASGSSGTATVNLCSGDSVTVGVASLGSYTYEVGFTVVDPNGDTVLVRNYGSSSTASFTATNVFGTIMPFCWTYINEAIISQSSDVICRDQTIVLSTQLKSNWPSQIPSNLMDSLLLWMPFNGTIEDESPNNVSLINHGATLGPGRNGSTNGGMYLNGNSFIETLAPLLTGQKQVTFSFWANSNYSYSQDVIGQYCGTDCQSDIRIQLNTAQCGTEGIGFKSPAHFAAASLNYDTSWHHYTVVLGTNGDYSYQNIKFYIDGTQVQNTCGHNWGGWNYTIPNFPLAIGKGASLGANFNGFLDDIAVWKKALDSAEISQLFSTPVNPNQNFSGHLWNTGEITPSIQVSPFSTSQYWVKVFMNDTVRVDTATVYRIQAKADKSIICTTGDEVQLYAFGYPGNSNIPFNWSTGSIGDSISVFPSQTSTYFLSTIVDSVQCTDSLTVYLLPSFNGITRISDTICEGEYINISIDLEKINPTSIQSNSTLNDSLILWMPINGSIENEVDFTPLQNLGVKLGPGHNSTSNGGLYFDGQSYLETDSALLVGQQFVTFAFWAKSNSTSSQDVIGQFCGTDCQGDVRIQLNTTGCGDQGLGFKSPAHFALAPFENENSWHHYAVVMGAGNFSYQSFKFYIDGDLVSVSCGHNWGGWSYSFPNFPLSIGKGASLASNFTGYLDDIAIWKRELTQNEIIELIGLDENTFQSFTDVTWSTGEETESIQISPISTQSIWVKTQFGDCINSDTITITVVGSDLLPDSIIYGGDTLEVSANFGVSGTWSHDNSFGSHVTLLGYEGPIVFSHTNPMGCTLTDTTYVINLDTLYVSTSGSDNNDGRITHPYATIQAAVDASDEDDVILVNPGTYGPFSITWKEIMVSGTGSQ